jgi:hypothetical protein
MHNVSSCAAGLVLSVALAAQPPLVDFRPLGRHEFPPLSGTTRDYEIVDVSGDGRPDVYISKGGGGGTDQLLIACPGGGYLVSSSNLPAIGRPSHDVAAVDIDADGDLDFVTAGFTKTACDANRVLVNRGNGVFDDQTAARLPPSCGRALAVGNINDDAYPDLFFAGVNSNPDRIFLNNGAGEFREVFERLPPLPPSITSAVLFDADGDGDDDLALAQSSAPAQLLLNTAGTFTEQTAFCFPTILPAQVVVAKDFDGDADMDLVFAGPQNPAPGQCRIMRNIAGSGCFAQELLTQVRADARGVGAGDFDGDGDLDLAFGCVTTTGAAAAPEILANDGRGAFMPSSWVGPSLDATTVGCGDIDGDDDADLWIGTPGRDAWFASYEWQLDAPRPPQRGIDYEVVLTAAGARQTATTALVLIGSDYLQPRLRLPFGGLGVRLPFAILPLPLEMSSGSARIIARHGVLQGYVVMQALVVPDTNLNAARFTNVIGDSL